MYEMFLFCQMFFVSPTRFERVTYWKIWSKTGLGDRLKEMPTDLVGAFDGVGGGGGGGGAGALGIKNPMTILLKILLSFVTC